MSMDSQEIILKSIKLADTCKVNGDLILNVKKTHVKRLHTAHPAKLKSLEGLRSQTGLKIPFFKMKSSLYLLR